jgi:hypothetical protein
MTEYPSSQAPEDLDGGPADVGPEEASYESPEPTHTGVPAVDEVLAAVDRLDTTPLEEHLPAFEQAHDALRSALDADPGEPA